MMYAEQRYLKKKNRGTVRTEIVHVSAFFCPIYILFLINEEFFPLLVDAVALWCMWYSEADYMMLLIFTLCLCVVPRP
jgi:hypothetical protein